ncbi:hypothetical protein K501DRAFT_262937 [Backusella circina FSU 941]|nr:hypothetical protein K501DRAFT_233808 [Backusella circina FSU 941]KAI8875994.1 hypothetical protein K501DRAFT_262937 [Backusella circina FSU 941]
MNSQPASGSIYDLQRQRKNSQISSPPSLFERRQSGGGGGPEMILPMPTGTERLAALKGLGVTFQEAQRRISKIATPNETVVPSFVDSQHLETLIFLKQNKSLEETGREAVAD